MNEQISGTVPVPDGAAALTAFAEWIVAMDDPENDHAMSERRTVTMTQIIERARQALAAAEALSGTPTPVGVSEGVS